MVLHCPALGIGDAVGLGYRAPALLCHVECLEAVAPVWGRSQEFSGRSQEFSGLTIRNQARTPFSLREHESDQELEHSF